jgi:hypothetical protein
LTVPTNPRRKGYALPVRMSKALVPASIKSSLVRTPSVRFPGRRKKRSVWIPGRDTREKVSSMNSLLTPLSLFLSFSLSLSLSLPPSLSLPLSASYFVISTHLRDLLDELISNCPNSPNLYSQE